jgi:hypothetical protein
MMAPLAGLCCKKLRMRQEALGQRVRIDLEDVVQRND